MIFKKAGALLVLVAATVFLYSSVFKAEYQTWDDLAHAQGHPLVMCAQWPSLPGIFLKENTANGTYIPLAVASVFLEKKLFGLSSFTSHAVNLAFHVLVVLCVLFFARQMGLSFLAAYMAAVLFAIHPMHVEPVAWVTGRKDLLCAFFYLLALIFYCRFLKTDRAVFYIGALLMACLSVFSKSVALSLPLALILIDWVQGRRIGRRSLLQKMPFFIVVGMIAGITYLLNSRPAALTFPGSFLIWGWSAFFYLKTFFFPVGLSVLYPVPQPVSFANPEYWGAWLGIVVLGGFLFRMRKAGWFVFAVCFYVLSLFFLWRLDVRLTEMVADRYMYLPSIGFCLLAGYIIERLMQEPRWRMISGIIVFVLCGFLMIMTFRQTLYWKNSWTLWSHVLELRPDVFYAHSLRTGAVLDDQFYKGIAGDFEDFVERSLPSSPQTPSQHLLVQQRMRFFRGLYCVRWYRRELVNRSWAADEFQQISTDYLYLNCGDAFSMMGDHHKALAYYEKALNTGHVNFLKFMKVAKEYARLGQHSRSIEYVSKAIDHDPGNYDMLLLRGSLYLFTGKPAMAMDDAERLLAMDDQNPQIHHLLFRIFLLTGKVAEARMVLDREMVLWPNEPQVLWHRGAYAEKTGDKAAAVDFYQRARRLGYVP